MNTRNITLILSLVLTAFLAACSLSDPDPSCQDHEYVLPNDLTVEASVIETLVNDFTYTFPNNCETSIQANILIAEETFDNGRSKHIQELVVKITLVASNGAETDLVTQSVTGGDEINIQTEKRAFVAGDKVVVYVEADITKPLKILAGSRIKIQ